MYTSTIYLEAKEQLLEALKSKTLTLGNFGEDVNTVCMVEDAIIEDEDNETRYANLTLVVRYVIQTQHERLAKIRKLRLLTKLGDTLWTNRLKALVWETPYPDSVAIDVSTGEIFFVSLRNNELHLTYFNKFSEQESDIEALLENLEEREPYRIKINEYATYEVLDGSEGYRHLYRNIQIVFNSSYEIIIDSPLIV